MAYINKGDKLKVRGVDAIATSEDYTKMVYDDYDYQLAKWGYEGGSAMGYVNVVYTESGWSGSVPVKYVTKA